MSLSFLVPAFLVGLLALAVPVLIHLTRRQTREAVKFPSLMFVRRIPHRSTQRRRIHRWPLLLLRCAALALLVLAFARPFLDTEKESLFAARAGGREVVVALDRSYSMGYGDRWERAVESARQTLDGLGPQDRATLLFFDSRTEPVSETAGDRGLLRSALAEARPGPRSTRYAPALRHAQRVLGASPLPRREMVVISDFQRSGWEADAAEAASIRLPEGTTVTPVDVGGAPRENVTVASLTFQRSLAAGRERVSVVARVMARGESGRASLPVTLEVDGRTVESRTTALEPDGVATVEFDPLTLPETGSVRGVVRTPEDALPADDAFHFVLSADQRIPVLVLYGNGRSASYYLGRALAIGDSPGFRTVVKPAGQLRAADLAARPVVILDQAPLPDGELGRRLRALVEAGGGVVMVLGGSSTGEWEGVLPGRLPGAVDLSARGTTLGYLDLGHPVFEPFSAPRSGDFTAARVHRYRPLPAGSVQRVLARYGDGGIALGEQRVGKGRVLLWTSTLDGQWNDLALQPVYLPFLHQLVKYAAGYAPVRSWLTVGDPFDPGPATPLAVGASVMLTPSGNRIPLEDAAPLALEEPGFYELRDRRTGERGTTVAVNVDPGESDLEPFDPAEMVSALTATGGAAARTSGEVALTPVERERRQSGWWYLVVIAFVLLAAETVLANRMGGRGTATR